jgi:hypothetical protein
MAGTHFQSRIETKSALRHYDRPHRIRVDPQRQVSAAPKSRGSWRKPWTIRVALT